MWSYTFIWVLSFIINCIFLLLFLCEVCESTLYFILQYFPLILGCLSCCFSELFILMADSSFYLKSTIYYIEHDSRPSSLLFLILPSCIVASKRGLANTFLLLITQLYHSQWVPIVFLKTLTWIYQEIDPIC